MGCRQGGRSAAAADTVNMTQRTEKGRIRKHLIFSGFVQGVGFRWRAAKAAEMYGCTGWVKNEYDGSVTMEIQGSEGQIDQVILAIERGAYVRIENMDVRSLPIDPEERSFRTDW